jgi:hypothetical protein
MKISFALAMCLATQLVIGVVPTKTALAQTKTDDVVARIAKQQEEYEKNLNVVTRFHFTNYLVDNPPVHQSAEAMQAVTGRKYIFDLYYTEKPDPRKPFWVYDGENTHALSDTAFDADKLRFIYGDTQPRSTKSGGRTGQYGGPGDYGYDYAAEPISNLLATGKWRLSGTEDDAQFGKLYVVQGTYRQIPLTMKFAENLGFFCVFAGTSPPPKSKKWIDQYQVKRVATVDGVTIAQEVERTGIYRDTPADKFMHRYRITKVRVLSVNKLKDENFTVKIPKGGQIYDQDKNKVYKMSSRGPEIDRRATMATQSGAHPMMFVGWLFVGSVATLLTLGLTSFTKWRQGG